MPKRAAEGGEPAAKKAKHAAATPEENKALVGENRAALFRVESQVMDNRGRAYLCRSKVQENAALISKNYSGAFIGNRQLINQNTDDLFRNRQAIVRGCKVDHAVQAQVNFREAKLNEAKIAFLEHRAALNEKVFKTSQRLAALNAEAIQINRDIMAANAEAIAFNAEQIKINSDLLKSGLSAAAATPESNSELIHSNADRIAAIGERAADNRTKGDALEASIDANRADIEKNAGEIEVNRAKVIKNKDAIHANQEAVATFVGST